MKNPENALEYTIQNCWKRICIFRKEHSANKILMSEELTKQINPCIKLCYMWSEKIKK